MRAKAPPGAFFIGRLAANKKGPFGIFGGSVVEPEKSPTFPDNLPAKGLFFEVPIRAPVSIRKTAKAEVEEKGRWPNR